ncbi:polysaccharide deacetylase family protein [Sphingomonas daechungensis]
MRQCTAFAIAVLMSTGCASAAEQPLQIAITVDDLPVHGPFPKTVTPENVAHEVIAALKAEKVEAYGFVNGYWTARDPSTAKVLQAWKDAALPLANHGWAHRHLSEISAAEFEQELLKNDPVLKPISTGDWRWFRYPYLDEGGSPEKRAASREVLARHGYKIAAVTMDFSDWAWTAPYARCMDSGNVAGVAKLEETFLESARENIGYFRQLSKTVYGRDIPYVLLLHTSAFEGKMLPRLLKLYRDEGFTFVSLAQAEADPAYADQTSPALPAEPQGLERKASAKGPLPSRTDYQPILESMCKA